MRFPAYRQLATVFGLSILLIVASRLPLMPKHLYSFDAVNLALALKDFDPTANQPQPPGYPFFVGKARLAQLLFVTPERTFMALGLLISGLSLGMLYLLGERLFSPWIGLIASGLFLVNPPFWYASLTSPLRQNLALISIVFAYCCWRASEGENRYFLAASVVLGLGGGIRPELPIVLLPLWIWTGFKVAQRKILVHGHLLLLAGTLSWLATVVVASGGPGTLLSHLRDYLVVQTSQTSPVLNAPLANWRRMLGRCIVWYGIGAIGWIWALPFGWWVRRRWPAWQRRLGFLLVWFVPVFLFNAVVHIGASGQALAGIPPLCLLGGFCLVGTEEFLARRWLPQLNAGILLSLVILLSTPWFFGEFLPTRSAPVRGFRGLASVADAFRYGSYETSYARVRWTEQTTDLGFQQIEALQSSSDRPILVVWSRNAAPVWRQVAYYFPSTPIYVLEEAGDPAALTTRAQLWVDAKLVATYSGPGVIRVSVPKEARLIWLLAPGAGAHLRRAVELQSAPPLYYTDMPANTSGFQWRSFEFVPEKVSIAGVWETSSRKQTTTEK